MEFLEPYKVTILSLGLLGLLYWLQLAVVDCSAMLSRKTPGYSVEQNHQRVAFRVNRALANSNESAAIYILAIVFAIFSSAQPDWLNTCSVVYLLSRAGHMLFYYVNFPVLRSLSFAVSFLALIVALGIGFWAWI